MQYTDNENNELTETEMCSILVNAVRNGVDPALPIHVYMSFEKFDQLIKNLFRITPGRNFGSIVYDSMGGSVVVEAIKSRTDTITVSN